VIEIDRDELAAVAGGETSQQSVNAGLVSVSSTRTNYATCIENVKEQTAQQYPSTRPWYNPFATDTNAGPRAQATMQNMRDVCGLPPS
jgi:hypothetical protein